MTNKVILEKAILKAIGGGWMDDIDSYSFVGNKINFNLSKITTLELSYPEIIFDHDFAKAVWPDVPIGMLNSQPVENTVFSSWKSRLQEMVIAEDPIKYLGDNI